MTTEHKVLRIVQPESVAILQHAAWHRACVAELLEAFSAGDIVASMNFASPVDSGDGLRTVLSWQMTSTGVGQNAAIGVFALA